MPPLPPQARLIHAHEVVDPVVFRRLTQVVSSCQRPNPPHTSERAVNQLIAFLTVYATAQNPRDTENWVICPAVGHAWSAIVRRAPGEYATFCRDLLTKLGQPPRTLEYPLWTTAIQSRRDWHERAWEMIVRIILAGYIADTPLWLEPQQQP